MQSTIFASIFSVISSPFRGRRGLKVIIKRKNLLPCFPLSFCKIRDMLQLSAFNYTFFAKRSDAVPCCQIIYIQWKFNATLYAFYKSMIHEEIHATMTGTFSVLAILYSKRVIVFLHICFRTYPGVFLAFVFKMYQACIQFTRMVIDP